MSPAFSDDTDRTQPERGPGPRPRDRAMKRQCVPTLRRQGCLCKHMCKRAPTIDRSRLRERTKFSPSPPISSPPSLPSATQLVKSIKRRSTIRRRFSSFAPSSKRRARRTYRTNSWPATTRFMRPSRARGALRKRRKQFRSSRATHCKQLAFKSKRAFMIAGNVPSTLFNSRVALSATHLRNFVSPRRSRIARGRSRQDLAVGAYRLPHGV
jgi:hypothetical protein